VQLVHRVIQDLRVIRVKSVLVIRDLKGFRGYRAVCKGGKVIMAHRDHKASKEMLAHRAIKVIRAFRVQQELMVKMVYRVFRVMLEQVFKGLKAMLEFRAGKEIRVGRVLEQQVLKEMSVKQVDSAHKVQLAQMVCRVIRAGKDQLSLAQQDHREQKELRVHRA
jgi:hypothetical protein